MSCPDHKIKLKWKREAWSEQHAGVENREICLCLNTQRQRNELIPSRQQRTFFIARFCFSTFQGKPNFDFRLWFTLSLITNVFILLEWRFGSDLISHNFMLLISHVLRNHDETQLWILSLIITVHTMKTML